MQVRGEGVGKRVAGQIVACLELNAMMSLADFFPPFFRACSFVLSFIFTCLGLLMIFAVFFYFFVVMFCFRLFAHWCAVAVLCISCTLCLYLSPDSTRCAPRALHCSMNSCRPITINIA